MKATARFITLYPFNIYIYLECGFCFCCFALQKTQTQNSFSNADLPKHFTDATRAILVDWLIQVHVSLTADGVSSPSVC